MNGYNFTERVRKVLAMSREEAAKLDHEYVGTEHMLLGIIREGEGVAANVLQNLSADLNTMRGRVLGILKSGRGGPTGPDLPYTTRAKKILELAMSEARRHHHSYVGTEHLLLGMIAEEKGIAAQVLMEAGVTLEKAREETLRILGREVPGHEPDVPRRAAPLPEAPGRSGALRPVNDVPQSITVELQYADGTVHRRKCLDRLEAMRFLVQ